MQFFDDKQEVMEIILTSYGKYLISQGHFDPYYYSFFDDNILYDSQWASGSALEIQNDIEGRIQDSTPSIKSPSTYTGIETLVESNADIIKESIFAAYGSFNPPHIVHNTFAAQIYNQKALQPVTDQFEFLSMPLGTSDISSKYYPSWNVAMLKGEIGDSQNYLATAKRSIADIHPPIDDPIPTYRYEQIPQIEITSSHKIYVSFVQTFQGGDVILEGNNEDSVCAANATFPMPTDIEPMGVSGEFLAEDFKKISSQIYSDGTFYAITDGNIIIDLTLNNTMFRKENFDIQVFMSSSTVSSIDGSPQLLYFAPSNLDLPTEDDVQKYLSLRVDREINTAAIGGDRLEDLTQLRTDSSTTNVISTREFLIRDLYRPSEEGCDE